MFCNILRRTLTSFHTTPCSHIPPRCCATKTLLTVDTCKRTFTSTSVLVTNPHDDVQLIDTGGKNLGIMSYMLAEERAKMAKLFLLKLSESKGVEIYKLVDGMYRTKQERVAEEVKKKELLKKELTEKCEQMKQKELQLSMTIEDHDLQIRVKQAQKFIGTNCLLTLIVK